MGAGSACATPPPGSTSAIGKFDCWAKPGLRRAERRGMVKLEEPIDNGRRSSLPEVVQVNGSRRAAEEACGKSVVARRGEGPKMTNKKLKGRNEITKVISLIIVIYCERIIRKAERHNSELVVGMY